MGKKLLITSSIALCSLLLTSCGTNLKAVTDTKKKEEVRTTLTEIKHPKTYSSAMSINSSSLYTFDNNEESRYINATIDVDLSWLVANFHLYGTIKGLDINNDNYNYKIELHDSGNNAVADATIKDEVFKLNTYEFKVLGNTLIENSSNTVKFDDDKILDLINKQNFDFMSFLDIKTTEDFNLKADETNSYLKYVVGLSKEEFSGITKTYLGITPSAFELFSYLDDLYLGPTVDVENYLIGFTFVAKVNYGITIDLTTTVTIDNSSVPTL